MRRCTGQPRDGVVRRIVETECQDYLGLGLQEKAKIDKFLKSVFLNRPYIVTDFYGRFWSNNHEKYKKFDHMLI